MVVLAENLERLWEELPQFRNLLDGLRKGLNEQVVFGLQAGQVGFLLSRLFRDLRRPMLVITPGFREALDLSSELAVWLSAEQVFYYPPQEVVPYAVIARSPDIAGQRLQIITRLALGEEFITVAPIPALLRPLPPRDSFSSRIVKLTVGGNTPLDTVVVLLSEGGYERVDRVEGPGQFAVRGGIIDVFPLVNEKPVRVEWFGDEIESIRYFNTNTQRSEAVAKETLIPPAHEVVVPLGRISEAMSAIREELAAAVARLRVTGRTKDAATLRDRIESHLSAMTPALWEIYSPYLYPPDNLLSYFPKRPLVAVIDAKRVQEALSGTEAQWRERTQNLLETGRLLPGQQGLMFSADDWSGVLASQQVLYLSSLPQSLPGGMIARPTVSISGKPVPSFRGQWDIFIEELRSLLRQGYRCVLTAATDQRCERLVQALKDEGLIPLTDTIPPPEGFVAVIKAGFASGFIFPGLRLALVTEEEVFGKRKRLARKGEAREGEGEPLSSFTDLKVGDYVVHVHHGIGRYLGIKTLEVQGAHRDYLYIQYAGKDRLYVPVDQINLIQKYVGGEAAEPKLYKLGGSEWARVKQRVKDSVRKMAEELLRLYAARQALQGHAFPADTIWQKQFEDTFPYHETPDQLKAIEEIKRDMERPQPMDRLLCGDVGFGKTEVAMRAAFKAVADGKQVAVLVPTTILAQQHYVTFCERFEGFPVKIDVLSRFRTRKEQEACITGLRRGEIDIVIGTHRLLAGDVYFKDLGLLIIDEEHRFGVAQKEAIKRLKATVDVLTMTATPIPRTLHMALAGLRDMSVISTPPENRLPVETYVVEYDDDLIREAINQELSRGGQVFYVHNRVRGINRVYQNLQRLVPGARIAVAHGQMPEDELEQTMMEFLDGRYDILLSTSIIESGLDIPNANTLVVEDSDRFGLAQLYQIRGRVGRSSRLAYAYFTYRRDRVLGEVAQKRLEAIKEFTELGSGFKIALRDLEIRGAGNILGPEQHGFIVSVGFDLYCQLLEESVRELKGERVIPQTEPAIELVSDAYLDDTYISDARAKIELYKKISAARTLPALNHVRNEMKDRFGALPEAAENLLRLAEVRIVATNLGVLSITQEGKLIRIVFAGYLKDLLRGVETLRDHYGRRIQIQMSPRPMIRFVAANDALAETLGLLNVIASLPEIRSWLSDHQNPESWCEMNKNTIGV